MSSPFVDLDGSPISLSRVLGYGRTGVVISRDDTTAVKIPIRWVGDTSSDFDMNLVSLRREQDIYRRIGRCSGIVPCVGYPEKAIELEWMKNGDLRYPRPESSSYMFNRVRVDWRACSPCLVAEIGFNILARNYSTAEIPNP
jgi:hypothetical protein